MSHERKPPVVTCPVCGKSVEWGAQSPYRPFCSERCKLTDLGQWANEHYRVTTDAPPLDQEDDPAGHA